MLDGYNDNDDLSSNQIPEHETMKNLLETNSVNETTSRQSRQPQNQNDDKNNIVKKSCKHSNLNDL